MPPATLLRDPFGRLVLSVPGVGTFDDVTPVRCFPLTAPDGLVSFCHDDGRELWSATTLDALDPDARALLAEELARREFIPKIKQIRGISTGPEPTTWRVETDRGESTFALANEDDVRRLGAGALVTDTHGIRYRIVTLDGLDRASRRLLQRYL